MTLHDLGPVALDRVPAPPADCRLCFAHVCDTHVTDAASAEIVAAAVPAINHLGSQFVAFGGDLANHGAPESFEHLKSALTGLVAPCHFIIGNHDMLGGKDAFQRHLGPLNSAFDAGGYHVICLDSTGRTSLTWEGLFSGEAIAWLGDHLPTVPVEQPLILFTHHGIHSHAPHAPKQNLLWDVLNWRPVHRLLAPHNLVLTCAGHTHGNAREEWQGTQMLWTAVLSSVRQNDLGLPPGFRMVWLGESEIRTAWVHGVVP